MKRTLYLSLFFLLSCSQQKVQHNFPSDDYASKAVRLSLHCVDQEHPHYYDRVKKGADAKAMHPAFYGCFDWHSSVHGHWAMLRLLDTMPNIPERKEIIAALNRHLTTKNLLGELAYLEKDPEFEWPYGNAWFLRLAEELHHSQVPEARAWLAAVAPVEALLVSRYQDLLRKQSEPVRIGLHDNTAFGLTHAWDYAVSTGNTEFQELIRQRGRDFYAADENCSIASELGPSDFISPCMVEADFLRRILPAPEFRIWLGKFLPSIPEAYLRPVIPANPKDYFESHLVGLMFQKASSMRAVAQSLEESDPRRIQLQNGIENHLQAGWKLLFDTGYGGAHWIASFVIFMYTEAGLR